MSDIWTHYSVILVQGIKHSSVLMSPFRLYSLCVWGKIMNKQMGGRTHRQTADHKSDPLLSAAVTLLHSRTPCQVFQARSQTRGSGGLEACSLVKYLNYVIDVSTVINLAAAHPSSWPVPAQLHGALWRSCQTGPDEVCVCVFAEAFCFDSWGDYPAVVNYEET